jgi:hypothetical protein
MPATFSLAPAFMPGIAAMIRLAPARFSGLTGTAALAIGDAGGWLKPISVRPLNGAENYVEGPISPA